LTLFFELVYDVHMTFREWNLRNLSSLFEM